mmetsp:Transcript_12910/g.27970  ORF Transcript_12910/g.27970 Transcript_12910/m.27970 type:complete len:91 (-) Transcript_12910:838-1110(-)
MHPNDQVFSLNVEATMVKTIHRFSDSNSEYNHDSDHALIVFKVHEQVKLTYKEVISFPKDDPSKSAFMETFKANRLQMAALAPDNFTAQL